MSYIVDSSVTFTPSQQQIFIEVSIFADFFLSVRGWIMSAPPPHLPPIQCMSEIFRGVFVRGASYTVYCILRQKHRIWETEHSTTRC